MRHAFPPRRSSELKASYCRCRFNSGIGIEEKDAEPAGKKIFHCTSHFPSHSPNDLRFGIGKAGMQGFAQWGVLPGQFLDQWSVTAINFQEIPACHTCGFGCRCSIVNRSEEHTSELPSLMRIAYDVFLLKKK